MPGAADVKTEQTTGLPMLTLVIDRAEQYWEHEYRFRRGEFESLLSRRSDPARIGRPDVYERRRPDGVPLP